MKNFYLILLFLFSFGLCFSQTQDSLSVEEQQRREKNIQAGNPFEKFGYKPKISTLSKGKYLEFHDLDSIVLIGSFTFHVKKKIITGYILRETKYSEATLRPEVVSRWFNPDPLADEFPSWSPYNFTYNNPVFFTDPTGLAAFAYDNDYGVDKNGNISLIKKTDDNFDRLYAVDENGNKKDTNADGSISENDAVTFNDQSILPSLSNKKSTKTKSGAKSVSYAFTQNSEDAFNIFTFAANNSSVEWGLNKYRNTSGNGSDWFFMGTYHLSDLSPTPEGLFKGFGNVITRLFNVHSHPGFNKNDKDWGDGVRVTSSNQMYPGGAGDWVNVRNSRNTNAAFYIYYPNFQGLYQYTPSQPRIKVTTVKSGGSLEVINQ